MKKTITVAAICIILIAAVICAFFLIKNGFNKTVDTSNYDKGSYDLKSEETAVSGELDEDSLLRIKNVFNGKELLREAPDASFNENRAITLGDGQIYYISDDGSGYVYWKNENKYFKLSEAQYGMIERVLKELGLNIAEKE